MNQFGKQFAVEPGKAIEPSLLDPDFTCGFNEEGVANQIEYHHRLLEDLQLLLYAEHKRSLLIVLQGMDGAGKDGTISHVMRGVNPQSCRVASFKVPTPEELDHDFLWRVHKVTPSKGEIVIFNRSHYEDVLIARVHNLVPEQIWPKRYDLINNFERLLFENNTTVLKFYLNISKEEQRKRMLERINDPSKNWKMSLNDLKERDLWDNYMKAYEDALSKCSTENAPWYVIPSNKKWFRNYAIGQIINDTLAGLNMELPKPPFDPKKITID
jgi:PPK2 family polyphosphate:nucleotide phosphotransferase